MSDADRSSAPASTGALRFATSPLGVSLAVAAVAAAVLYRMEGKATAILGSGLAFFVAWVASNVLLGLPPPSPPRSDD